jgi:hypothetical protein
MAVMMWRKFRPKRRGGGAGRNYEEVKSKGTVERIKKERKIRRRDRGGKKKICFLIQYR